MSCRSRTFLFFILVTACIPLGPFSGDDLLAQGRAGLPRPRSWSDLSSIQTRLIRHYRARFRAITFERKSGPDIASTSTRTYLTAARRILRNWDAARGDLIRDYGLMVRRERVFLIARQRAALRRTQKTRNASYIADFGRREKRRARERRAQFRRIQALLDGTAIRVNQRFKYYFHTRLARDILELNAAKAGPERALARKQDTMTAIRSTYTGRGRVGQRRRAYLNYWVNWFYKNSRFGPRVVFKKSECLRNECSLAEYRAFISRLPRSCYKSRIPDIIIRSCDRYEIILDLSTPRKREIHNFLRFDGDNYYERMRGLTYFEEYCYAFRPVLELGREMLEQPGRAIAFEQKRRIQSGLRNISACAAK